MNFKAELIKSINESLKIKNAADLLEIPPNPKLGDFAFPCFTFTKEKKKSPAAIALEFSEQVDYLPFIDSIKATGPYVNFFIKKGIFAKKVLNNIDSNYGKGKRKPGKVMIEYSAPNPLKSFHLGHVRNTSLGASLGKIMQAAGYNVVFANYINDKGSHIGKWIWCYNKYHKGEKPPTNIERWLADIYVESHKKSEGKEAIKKEIATINKAIILENNSSYVKQWKQGVEWSMKSFKQIYSLLNAPFDHYFFESPLNKRSSEIVELLQKKKIAEKSEGAVILDFEKYKLHKAVIQREDGTNLYLTSDFALAEEKFNNFKITKSIYVVGAEQKLHFRQLFKALELMGFKQAPNSYHLSYELVRFPGKRMSSRTGDNQLFTEFLDEVKKLTFIEVDKRHPSWNKTKKEKTALDIAIAAIKFGMLKQDSNKVIVFDPNKEVSFEGETGPYLQYSHARANSILKKGKLQKANLEVLDTEDETALINKLQSFPSIIEKAANDYKPNLLANYLIELAQQFNSYYHSHPVIQADKTLMNARLVLVDKVRIVLEKGLLLLGIQAPKEM